MTASVAADGTPVAGTEALSAALRRAVARGQAATDARQAARLVRLARSDRFRGLGSFALPPIATLRRYRIVEVSIAFEAEVRNDPAVEGGLVFVAAAPPRRPAPVPAGMAASVLGSWLRRLWPGSVSEVRRERRFAPVTITIRPAPTDPAGRDATATGMER